MRRSRNRRSAPRRAGTAIAAAVAIAVWCATVLVWTSVARVTSSGGFTDVTLEVIQTPEGSQAVTDALLASVDTYAAAQGYDLTATGREQIATQVAAAITGADVPDLMAPAMEQTRAAYEADPDGSITIDFSALRPVAVEWVQQVDPSLVAAIPSALDLTVTVEKQDVPAAASTVAGTAAAVRWLPLWLLLGTLAAGGLALWASVDRPRMLRMMGIGSLVVAIVPLVLRLVVPPAAASFAEGGTASDLLEVTATAILAHWWIALIVCLVVGTALLGGGIRAGRTRTPRRAPVVLGR